MDEIKIQLDQIQEEQEKVIQTFVAFYGPDDAESWYSQVKSNYAMYLSDKRPIFKNLANLEADRIKLMMQMEVENKKLQYKAITLEEATEKIIQLELEVENLKGAIQESNCLQMRYVCSFGGFSGSQAVSSCVAVELSCGREFSLPDMPTARYNSAAVAVGPYVYVAGGNTSDQTLTNAFEVLNFSTGQWIVLDNIPELLGNLKACNHGPNVIVWGKKAGNLFIYMFDSAKQRWQPIPSPPFQTGSTQFVGYSSQHLICELVTLDRTEVATISMFCYDINGPTHEWTNRCNISSLSGLLETYALSIELSTCFGEWLCFTQHPCSIDQNKTTRQNRLNLTYQKFFNTNQDSYLFIYSLKRNSYFQYSFPNSRPQNQTFGKKPLTCRNDLVILEHFDPWVVRLFIPSSGLLKEITFDQTVQWRSVSLVCPAEAITSFKKDESPA